jgi:hypothetical protein
VSGIARLTVTLQGIRPLVWRRLEVPAAFSFTELSAVILAAFGWTNSHLHEFEVGPQRIGMPDRHGGAVPIVSDPLDGVLAQVGIDLGLRVSPSLEDEAAVALSDLLHRGVRSFTFIYDFGDDWRHLVTVEELQCAEEGVSYPRLVSGRHACPPEDCGGLPGYEHLIAVLADPGCKEYAELRSWCPSFDPEELDLVAADEAVRHPTEYSG